MANRRVGGILFIKKDGEQLQAKGAFTYNLGVPEREAVVGSDGVHGFSEMPRVPFIEGAITDSDELDLATLLRTRDSTVTIELANGKTVVLREAWFAGESSPNTETGEIPVRFEGIEGEEVAA